MYGLGCHKTTIPSRLSLLLFVRMRIFRAPRLTFICAVPRSGAIALSKLLDRRSISLPHTHIIARVSDNPISLSSPLSLYSKDDGLIRTISAHIFQSNTLNSIQASIDLIESLATRLDMLSLYDRFLPNSTSIFDPSSSLGLHPELLNDIDTYFYAPQIIHCLRHPLSFCNSILTSIHGLDSLLKWYEIYSEDNPSLVLDPLNMWSHLNKGIINQLDRITNKITKKQFKISYCRASNKVPICFNYVLLKAFFLFSSSLFISDSRNTIGFRTINSLFYQFYKYNRQHILKSAFTSIPDWHDYLSYSGDPGVNIFAKHDNQLIDAYLDNLRTHNPEILIEASELSCSLKFGKII